jgi:hypothetical protein
MNKTKMLDRHAEKQNNNPIPTVKRTPWDRKQVGWEAVSVWYPTPNEVHTWGRVRKQAARHVWVGFGQELVPIPVGKIAMR